MMPMRKIAEFYNIPIYSESNWFMSFGNSPYFSHYAGSAIDIYQGIRGFDGQLDAVSPIDGKIIDIIKIKPPIKKGYSKIDYIIALNPFSNDNYYVRMLHIAPKVKVGEYVSAGDLIGQFLRSGYFYPWTDPHIHFEIRSNIDRILVARDTLPLIKILFRGNEINSEIEFDVLLEKISKYYAIGKVISQSIVFENNSLFGLSLTKNGKNILDAGVPYYKKGLILSDFNAEHFLSGFIIENKNINISFEAYSKIFKGIGTAIYFSEKYFRIKLVFNNIVSSFCSSELEGQRLKINIKYSTTQ